MIYYGVNTIYFWYGVVVTVLVLWAVTSVIMAVMKYRIKKWKEKEEAENENQAG